MQIPICDPKQEYLALKDEIDAAIQGALESGKYILGPHVAAFEEEIAEYLSCNYAVGVNSGTDALHLALRALDIGPGDEVITTPFTFVATTEAIGMVGATPAFADIDPRTFNIDPHCIEDAITSKTKAILPVHLYGQPCDMDAIMEIATRHDLRVVEDCAQAIGASYRGKKVGTFGDAGCFSFFPSKNLSCFGDGGMLVTNNQQTFERVEMLRRHGGKVKYHHSELGLNSRLDELHAAILRVKLSYLDAWTESRRRHAYHYNDRFADCPGIVCPLELGKPQAITPSEPSNPRLHAVYHQYTLLVEHRDEVAKQLTSAGIGNAVYYPIPLHLQKVHRPLGDRRGDFPHAESVANWCLSLPMSSALRNDQRSAVAKAVVKCVHPSAHSKLIWKSA